MARDREPPQGSFRNTGPAHRPIARAVTDCRDQRERRTTDPSSVAAVAQGSFASTGPGHSSTPRRVRGGRGRGARRPTTGCHYSSVRLVISAPAAEAINRHGGRLYVWPKRSRCCGGGITLVAATSPPADKDFRREQGTASFDLYLPARLARLPDELHVETGCRSGRIQAYWNGCAWVV
jgi:hypothetical protein